MKKPTRKTVSAFETQVIFLSWVCERVNEPKSCYCRLGRPNAYARDATTSYGSTSRCAAVRNCGKNREQYLRL